MIDKEKILEYINKNGNKFSIKDIEEIIAKINEDDLKKAQEERFKYEIWDKKTAINGIDAKQIIKSRNYTIGQAYLIYIDGKLIYFQDHNPHKEGYEKMSKAEAEKIAKAFIQEKIEENIDNIIVNKIINDLLKQ